MSVLSNLVSNYGDDLARAAGNKIDDAEIAANEYKDKLLKEFSSKGGRDMLNKAIPAVSIIGGGSILGALLSGGNDNTQNRA